MLTSIRSYVSVAEKRAKAQKALSVLMENDTTIKPLLLNGTAICRSFWGRSWFAHFDEMLEFAPRMAKGRSFVRNNAVCHLDVDRGSIIAKVSGLELFNVKISIEPMSEEKWQGLKDRCQGLIFSHSDLMIGKISKSAKEIIANPKYGIFPHPNDIHAECDCSARGPGICNHIAAAICGVANRLDTEPSTLFLLRGVNSWELISEVPDSLRTRKVHPAEVAKPLEHFSPSVAVAATDSQLPIIVRRRNGTESRVRLSNSDGKEPAPLELEPQPEIPAPPVRKRRPYRPRSQRRAKGKWVSIDVDSMYPDAEYPDEDSESLLVREAQGASNTQNAPQKEEKHLKTQGQESRTLNQDALYTQEMGAPESKVSTAPALDSHDNGLTEQDFDDEQSNLQFEDKETEPESTDQRRSRRKVILKHELEDILMTKEVKALARTRICKPRRRSSDPSSIKGASAAPVKTRNIMKTSTQKTLTRTPKKAEKTTTTKATAKKATFPELDFNKVTGKSIKNFRKYLGLSLESFAMKLEMCVATVRRWEETGGKLALHYPSIKALKKLYNRELRKEAKES
ncbi:MAG: hypothetical protein LBF22_00945 [Deltaproteobacteria bacterium]|jgi:uncharacterized Zn finger protein/DNA-binding transcriptional regulator YiaG|nr:hypothetical protein [Deltaproteobacteria bacterium]